MKSLFDPRSLVVVGASDSPNNLAGNIVKNLDDFQFKGEVHLVGREEGSLNGRPIHASIAEVPGTPDLAVVLTPAATLPAIVEACGQKGIRRMVIESSGFAELSSQGVELGNQVLSVARKYGIRFVGPNCIGLMNLENGMVLPFVPMEPDAIPRGHISLVSQSGGMATLLAKLLAFESVGVNKVISMGNKLDLNENDYLDYLVQDPQTKVIGLFLESISDGRMLMEIAGSTTKPIVALKGNTTEASREVARFHTSAMAGDAQICRAAFMQSGIHQARTTSQFTSLCKAFLLPPMLGPNLAIIGRSGGQTVISADAAHELGFTLPRLPPQLLERIRQKARAGVINPTNPLDLGDVYDMDFFLRIVEWTLGEEDIQGALVLQTYGRVQGMGSPAQPLLALKELSLRLNKPIALCVVTEPELMIQLKREVEFPLFQDPAEALGALAASKRHATPSQPLAKGFASSPQEPQRSPTVTSAPASRAFSLLGAYGIESPGHRNAEDLSSVLAAAGQLTYPVALKRDSPRLIHKADAGGVALNLAGPDELEAAFKDMSRNLPLGAEGMDGSFLVQQMAPSGVEVILGTKRDAEFGPIILFGSGGSLTEIYRDVAIRVAPVGVDQAAEMVSETKCRLLLEGFRGQPPADLRALYRTIAAFSHILLEHPEIVELEVNPLLIFGDGQGCRAVDARMTIYGRA